MWVGIGIAIGIEIGFYERHNKQELILFDPDAHGVAAKKTYGFISSFSTPELI